MSELVTINMDMLSVPRKGVREFFNCRLYVLLNLLLCLNQVGKNSWIGNVFQYDAKNEMEGVVCSTDNENRMSLKPCQIKGKGSVS